MDARCLVCGDDLVESPYPRHLIVLEDESEDEPNRRSEARLCRACWETFYSDSSSIRIGE